MSDFVYIAHAYTPTYKSKDSYKKRTSSDSYSQTKNIVGRRNLTTHRNNPYGNYKSPYYDPVARHERYEREKDHVTRPYGVGLSTKSGSGRGGGKGKSGGKGGRGGKGSAKKNLSDMIAKLRDASEEDIEKHRSEYLKEIEDLRKQLYERIEQLSDAQKDEESELNIAEIRGHIQSLREQIENKGLDLQKWINEEREALNRRIAALRN